MKTKSPLFALAVGIVALSAGCRFPSSTSIYDRHAAGRSMSVDTGDVVAVRDVQVAGRSTIIGTGGGAIIGSAAASGGSGVGGAVVQAASAVGGAILGEASEEALTRQNAQEVTIKMKNGETIVVVQEVRHEGRFRTGQHVQVLNGGGGTSVRRLD
jgi:outer membrane lipoprotein SlyB